MGSKGGDSGMGVMVAQKWTQNVIGVTRISDRLIVVRLSVGKTILNLISVYAPQAGRSMEDKEKLYRIEAGDRKNQGRGVDHDLW